MDNRVTREKEFHDHLASEDFASRKLIDRFTKGYYDKSRRSPIWAPVWNKIDLRGSIVLDYGCGDGGFSVQLSMQGAMVYGIDVSSGVLAMARRSVPASVPCPHFLVSDGQRTPFPDQFFDYVFGNGILHHLDPQAAVIEIKRVLKPNGKAFFMEPLDSHPFVTLARRLTPSARTVDERPLSFLDIGRMSRSFSLVSHTEHFLFALAAAPAHLLGRRISRTLIRSLDAFDQVTFRLIPATRRYAWLTMIEMQKYPELS